MYPRGGGISWISTTTTGRAPRTGCGWRGSITTTGRGIPPNLVAKALVACLLGAGLEEPLPERFDAAAARRWVEDIDESIRALL